MQNIQSLFVRKDLHLPFIAFMFLDAYFATEGECEQEEELNKVEGLWMLLVFLRGSWLVSCTSLLIEFSFCLSHEPLLQWLVENSLNVQKCQGRRFSSSDCQGLHLHPLNQFSYMIKAVLEIFKCGENQSCNFFSSKIGSQVPKH